MNHLYTRIPKRIIGCVAVATLALACFAVTLTAREREPNSVYAARRAQLVTQLNAPVVLFGFTGKEDASPSYVFLQEPNFYYLTGHNEEAAAILLEPPSKDGNNPQETLFLPPKNPSEERWNGPRMSPSDPGIAQRTGFASVVPFEELKKKLNELSKTYKEIYTLLPGRDDAGYPHAQVWSDWLTQNAPALKQRDATAAIGALRQIKSPGEVALLTKAIDLSIDAQLAAMRMVHPGLYEYQVAAKMVGIHSAGGCETEAYAPIVGTGFHSTILHFNELDAQIKDGDVVLMDVGGQYAGYTADITRTIPANGHYNARQRELYDVVLGAQNAALAAVKPGASLEQGSQSLYEIARKYLDAHGKDLHGKPLGQYFIHGLGHHIGLEVHDAGDINRPLEPGMVVTVEPGIYLPEENIGIRIEDDVLVTATGYQLLTARLPRTAEEIEAIMATGKTAEANTASEKN